MSERINIKVNIRIWGLILYFAHTMIIEICYWITFYLIPEASNVDKDIKVMFVKLTISTLFTDIFWFKFVKYLNIKVLFAI